MNDFDDHPFSRRSHQSEPGQRFVAGGRRYMLMGGVDNGAIGIVRKARDSETQQVVAVKFLAPEFRYIEASSWADIKERFRREGQKGTALEHENLVKVLAFEDNDEASAFEDSIAPINPFIVMEFIHGKTLESYIKSEIRERGEGSINVNPQTMRIALALTEALVYLHKRRIIHRDVKPANVFLSSDFRKNSDGAVKLGDFGVVKWNEFLATINSGQLTLSGQQGLGTLKYMSPEQAMKPKDADLACDVYSLGATILELFSCQMFSSNVQFMLVSASRRMRGSSTAMLRELGINQIPAEYEELFSMIVSMLALGPTSRPSSTKVRGHLRFFSEKFFGDPLEE